MKRLTSLPTTRYIFHGSEEHNEPDPRRDAWIFHQHEQECDAPSPTKRHAIDFTEAGRIVLGLLLAIAFFAIVNALTGEAQETQAGHHSAWQGPRMVARVQWGAR